MFSSDSDNCPDVGIGPPASVSPLAEGRLSPTNTPVFPPSSLSYQVLHGSMYSFLLVRYTCPFSAGVLPALLCLKVYSWGIHGERCTPHPPTPLPSCSPELAIFLSLSCKLSLHILNRNPLSDISFTSIFSHFWGCLFTLLVVSFADASPGVSISSWKYIKYAD